MCRYAFHVYKEHYACFRCRKMFRQTAYRDLSEYDRLQYGKQRALKCPQCGGLMHEMGLNFKAPRHHDIRQWRKVEILHQQGFTWHDCGCGGQGPSVARLSEVKSFLEDRERMKQQQEQDRQRRLKGEQHQAKKAARQARRKPKPIRWEFYPN